MFYLFDCKFVDQFFFRRQLFFLKVLCARAPDRRQVRNLTRPAFYFSFWRTVNLEKESRNDHIIRSSPSQMFCKIDVFKNFAKFTRKHLCWCLVFIKVLGWKKSQNLRKNASARVSFLIKFVGRRHIINIKWLINLTFFIAALIIKSTRFALFTEFGLNLNP